MSRYVAEVWTGNPREARVGNYVPQARTPEFREYTWDASDASQV